MMSHTHESRPHPLTTREQEWVEQLSHHASPFKLGWLSGFFSAKGLESNKLTDSDAVSEPAVSQATNHPIAIVYASQTGNAQEVAQQALKAHQNTSLNAELINVRDFKPKRLKNETCLVFITSTQGEGEPPDSAQNFFRFLSSKKAPDLSHLSYAVLGLGDSSYELFCQAAIEADQHLSELGASAIRPLQTLDVDYEEDAQKWTQQLIEQLKHHPPATPGLVKNTSTDASGQKSALVYNKKHPFAAELLNNQRLTSHRIDKDIRHYELSLENSGIHYQPGDTLGIYFENDPQAVDDLLKKLKLKGEEVVSVADESTNLRQALMEKLELTQSYPSFVKHYLKYCSDEPSRTNLTKVAEDSKTLRAYLTDRQIYDIVAEHPCRIQAQTLVDLLRKQQPRLYSIASAQSEVDDEVHLTIKTVAYEAFGHHHSGGASGYLSRLKTGETVHVFIQPNDFKLPEDPSAPIIMIGAGTGIAPFRGFLQEREQNSAKGKNWLFFGNNWFCDDFLYQTELQDFINCGLLTRLNTAFSRDQEEKIYVQHRLQEEGQELFEWLEQGAYVYVCGDASCMAKDVHQALINLVSKHGHMGLQQADTYLEELQLANRYQKDVY
ncbi:MAG: assimilatory sulfite reductase (NADPH) flavoprotein subunit [Hydrogenovibrio sp.]|uniref:assimilatory sulfite reductase (NADPH) flavoprotein subunit n=1 Tax=Hydrogenovibrio sp. TaxID=2065821 RepID=UPI0028703912|nr:assimilatory sulfite reductase (NADPH) flavoprotein subunit [Hydrogenovibrio sp.]MDR9499757.1 assimilatory sulfite reductase (NADPH) flavoprotein subunit [Hydrogenovibrio sp.]